VGSEQSGIRTEWIPVDRFLVYWFWLAGLLLIGLGMLTAGFVAFDDSADVDKAIKLGGEQLDGRPIRIDFAGNKPKKEGAWGGKW
jgi:hypothetical protein